MCVLEYSIPATALFCRLYSAESCARYGSSLKKWLRVRWRLDQPAAVAPVYVYLRLRNPAISQELCSRLPAETLVTAIGRLRYSARTATKAAQSRLLMRVNLALLHHVMASGKFDRDRKGERERSARSGL
jgi:hypothetical protein